MQEKPKSTLGFLATDREGDRYYNRLFGADSYLRINRKKYVKAQFLTSWTSYPTEVATEFSQPQGVLNGTLLDFVFRHESRDFGYYVTYRQATPEFRADLGYMPHVGYRNVNAVMIFASWKNPGHWYTFMNLTPSYEYEIDFDNRLIQKIARLTYNYRGPLQTAYFFAGNPGKKSYSNMSIKTIMSIIIPSRLNPNSSRFFPRCSFLIKSTPRPCCSLGIRTIIMEPVKSR